MGKSTLFAITVLFCSLAKALDTTAVIDKILVYEDGMYVYIYPVGGVQNPLPCHGSNGDYFSFSLTRPIAQVYLQSLLAAHARKVPVFFRSAEDCIDQSVSETLQYFRIEE